MWSGFRLFGSLRVYDGTWGGKQGDPLAGGEIFVVWLYTVGMYVLQASQLPVCYASPSRAQRGLGLTWLSCGLAWEAYLQGHTVINLVTVLSLPPYYDEENQAVAKRVAALEARPLAPSNQSPACQRVRELGLGTQARRCRTHCIPYASQCVSRPSPHMAGLFP
jgi:hypothetical protein